MSVWTRFFVGESVTPLKRACRVLIILALFLVTIHKGTFFTLLLIDELIVDSIVQVCIIVLLIDAILFPAFRAEFYNSTWRYQVGNFCGPDEGRVIFFDLLNLVALVNKH